MINGIGNNLILLMFAKFILNDVPHALDLIDDEKPVYEFLRKSPRGSAIWVSKDKKYAKIELTSMEDTNDFSKLLNAYGIRRKSERGVSKLAWEETSIRFRSTRGYGSEQAHHYPGWTYYISYEDLLRAMSAMNLQLEEA